jgi:TRAP-type mannitol/chloroaromatic compound transport system permease small subunit
MDYLQIIGYTGSVLVAISLMMSNIVRLRWINLFGAATFAMYGFLINAYPVLLLNGFIVFVDLFYLIKISRKKDAFELLQIDAHQSPFLKMFIHYHRKEILKYFPNFDLSKLSNPRCIFILRNLMPVGLFICLPHKGMLEIKLDFVVKEYRDLKNAYYMFHSRSEIFKEQGFQAFIIKSEIADHINYMKKIGFYLKEIDGVKWYYKEI